MKDEIAKLQGTWNIVNLEMEGHPMPAGALTGSKIVVEGSKFKTIAMGATYAGELELDAAAAPKTFDLKFKSGPEKGNTAFGIYELDGDNWKICFTVTGTNRPKAFATTPGSGHALELLQRDRGAGGAKPQATAVQPIEVRDEFSGEWAMVSGVRDGYKIEKSLVKIGRRVTTGDRTTVSFGAQVMFQATYTIDAGQTPCHVDFTLADGRIQHGIYELAGETLKLCYAAPGDARPAEFQSVAGDGRTVAVWNRVR